MSGASACEVYDTVSRLSRQLHVAQAELELYKAKLAMALETLRQYDENAARYIESDA